MQQSQLTFQNINQVMSLPSLKSAYSRRKSKVSHGLHDLSLNHSLTSSFHSHHRPLATTLAYFLFLKHDKITYVLGIFHWLLSLSRVFFTGCCCCFWTFRSSRYTSSKRPSLTALSRVTAHYIISQFLLIALSLSEVTT